MRTPTEMARDLWFVAMRHYHADNTAPSSSGVRR